MEKATMTVPFPCGNETVTVAFVDLYFQCSELSGINWQVFCYIPRAWFCIGKCDVCARARREMR